MSHLTHFYYQQFIPQQKYRRQFSNYHLPVGRHVVAEAEKLVELVVNVAEVIADRADAAVQAMGDGFVAQAFAYGGQHAPLFRG